MASDQISLSWAARDEVTVWLLDCWEGLEIEIVVTFLSFFFILSFNFSAAGKVEEGLEIKVVVIHPVDLTEYGNQSTLKTMHLLKM